MPRIFVYVIAAALAASAVVAATLVMLKPVMVTPGAGVRADSGPVSAQPETPLVRGVATALPAKPETPLVRGAAVAWPAKPETALVLAAAEPLPGNMARLHEELQMHSSIRYRILVVDDSAGEDKTDYLDRVAAAWGEPAADMLLLVVFVRDNYDIRFLMGAHFRQMGATVEGMLATVRRAYFPRSRQGDVAGGLAGLVAAVNAEYGESM